MVISERGFSRVSHMASDATAPPCFPYSPHARTEPGHRPRAVILFRFLSAVGGRFSCLTKQNAALRKTSAEGTYLLFSASLSFLCGPGTHASLCQMEKSREFLMFEILYWTKIREGGFSRSCHRSSTCSAGPCASTSPTSALTAGTS